MYTEMKSKRFCHARAGNVDWLSGTCLLSAAALLLRPSDLTINNEEPVCGCIKGGRVLIMFGQAETAVFLSKKWVKAETTSSIVKMYKAAVGTGIKFLFS